MNILIAMNTKYMGPTSVFIYSLCKHHATVPIDLYVAYHDLNENDFETMESILGLYENKRLHRINIGAGFSEQMDADDSFSSETYYRILALDYLPSDVDRIIYMDCDMVINGDLSEVYETEMGKECPLVVCKDSICYRDNAYNITKERSQIPYEYDYFNAGFLLMNVDYFRRRNEVRILSDIILHEGDAYAFHDQDILNHMYYDRVKFVPWEQYNIGPGMYVLDCNELSKGRIRYATYAEAGALVDKKIGIDVSNQLAANSKVIHFMWIFKPWLYPENEMPGDIACFGWIWINAKKEMLAKLPELARLYE